MLGDIFHVLDRGGHLIFMSPTSVPDLPSGYYGQPVVYRILPTHRRTLRLPAVLAHPSGSRPGKRYKSARLHSHRVIFRYYMALV
jgi:hypothetical protein